MKAVVCNARTRPYLHLDLWLANMSLSRTNDSLRFSTNSKQEREDRHHRSCGWESSLRSENHLHSSPEALKPRFLLEG